MKVLIVEDESPIADDLKETCSRILQGERESVHCELTLGNALAYVAENRIDVLLLDLNLSGKDGFDILREAVSYSFHTIVISANIDRAVEAFEHGVVDFIPKPYTESRIRKAFARLRDERIVPARQLRYLTVRKQGRIELIAVGNIEFIKGADVYAELFLKDGKKELHDKTLHELARMLPSNFARVHKSFIVDVDSIKSLRIRGGGRYEVELHSLAVIPVSRSRFKELRDRLQK